MTKSTSIIGRLHGWARHGLPIQLAVAVLAALFAAPAVTAAPADRPTGRPDATRSEVIASTAMVCAAQPLAVQIGIDILKKGGSAVDAAIAVNAALGLMEPVSCGVGGDLFAVVWDAKSQTLFGLNASGRSPALLTLDEVRRKGHDTIPYTGVLPWTVPGCVDGWFELHGKFGRLPMKEILAPAIAYAEKGFPVTEVIAHYWAAGGARLKGEPNFAATYLPGGRAPEKGDVFRNPGLAKTYRLLAGKGRDAFYRGEIARTVDAFSRRIGGYLRYDDLAAHRSTWVEPVGIDYRGYRLWELPPNGQGIAALQMLRILEGYDLAALGHNSDGALHLMIEAKKLAFDDRARLYADPTFVKIPVKRLLSREYAAKRRALIDVERALQAVPAGGLEATRRARAGSGSGSGAGTGRDAPIEEGDTTFLVVADNERNFVSLIQSNYAGFGAGPVPDGLGFCMQDRGALFNLDAAHPNALEPGKRPFHTIIPAMVTKDGKPVFAFGVMGGAMQPQGHVQVLANIVDFGMSVQEAGDAPRFRHRGSSQPTGEVMEDGGQVAFESGIAPAVIEALAAKGHRIVKVKGGFGGYQGIWWDRDRNVLIGGSESRKDGCAMGY